MQSISIPLFPTKLFLSPYDFLGQRLCCCCQCIAPTHPLSPFRFSGAHFRLRSSSATEDDVLLNSFLWKTCFITITRRLFAPFHLRSSQRPSLLIHSPISAEKRDIGRTVKPRLTVTSLLRPLFLSAQQNGHTVSC